MSKYNSLANINAAATATLNELGMDEHPNPALNISAHCFACQWGKSTRGEIRSSKHLDIAAAEYSNPVSIL